MVRGPRGSRRIWALNGSAELELNSRSYAATGLSAPRTNFRTYVGWGAVGELLPLGNDRHVCCPVYRCVVQPCLSASVVGSCEGLLNSCGCDEPVTVSAAPHRRYRSPSRRNVGVDAPWAESSAALGGRPDCDMPLHPGAIAAVGSERWSPRPGSPDNACARRRPLPASLPMGRGKAAQSAPVVARSEYRVFALALYCRRCWAARISGARLECHSDDA
jgi:hypothetical protein